MNGLREVYIAELKKLTRCPLDCSHGSRLEPLSDQLYFLWQKVMDYHDSELILIGEMLDIDNEPLDLKALGIEFEKEKIPLSQEMWEINIEAFNNTAEDALEQLTASKQWIDGARIEFQKLTTIFECRVADNKNYQKHYPIKGSSLSGIRSKTNCKGSPSLFYPGITHERLDSVLVSVMADSFWQIIRSETAKIPVDCMHAIGASKGKEARHLIFDLNKSAKLAHAYPILEEDLPPRIPIVFCDSLQ